MHVATLPRLPVCSLPICGCCYVTVLRCCLIFDFTIVRLRCGDLRVVDAHVTLLLRYAVIFARCV